MKAKNFRKRSTAAASEDSVSYDKNDSEDDQERILVLEEVKFLQKQREKTRGIPAMPIAAAEAVGASIGGLIRKRRAKTDGDGEKEASVLQDTFSRETAVTVEDPNMLRYIEKELAKKRGRHIDTKNEVVNDVKRAEDELYEIPEHLRVKRRNSEEKSSTQWTPGIGIAEVNLPMEYKLRNIEETVEATKKLRLMGRAKTDSGFPLSYSTAGYHFQRAKDFAEKQLRTEHSESSRPVESGAEGAVQRPAATDELMLERFRRRERHRLMRR